MSTWQIVFMLAVGAFAGWVDAVVGGGGLLQIPAMFLAIPGRPAATASGTSKVAAAPGTAVAAVTFSRGVELDKRFGAAAGAIACCFSAGGAWLASSIPSEVLKPIIISVLICVAAFMALRPKFGSGEQEKPKTRRRRMAAYLTTGCVIGFYDGFIGPGTGVFLIIALTSILGTSFVQSSAASKIINLITYAGSITIFAMHGHVMWLLGLSMGVLNMLGGRLGARMALTRGARFARVVLLLAVLGTAARLAL